MKIAMHDWPPLFARGCAGLAAALGLAIIAAVRGQNLLPSRSLAPRLALGAAINVFAWMGVTALALLWLTVAQAALLTFSMPIWATRRNRGRLNIFVWAGQGIPDLHWGAVRPPSIKF
jgi:drug/metabolite transporter (DMT)-like permease